MISDKWTPEERSLVGEKIVECMLSIPPENVGARDDLFVKLRYLETQPADFLEENRGEFLKYFSDPLSF